MKWIGLLLLLVFLAPFASAPRPVAAQQQCRIERVTYRVDGLQLISWIMKPAREGRFPVVVWLHGSKFATPLIASTPILNENSLCHPWVVSNGWMIFFAQTRGYGGSEGPQPGPTFFRDPMAFLHGRAHDVNASVEWLAMRPDVNAACIANTGWSQGGSTALLASGKKPTLYRATVAHAPGVWGGDPAKAYLGMEDLLREGVKIPTPILVQSNTTDALILLEPTQHLVRELQRGGRTVEYTEYTHSSGHNLFNLVPDLNPILGFGPTEKFQIWGADTTRFLERAFAGCAR